MAKDLVWHDITAMNEWRGYFQKISGFETHALCKKMNILAIIVHSNSIVMVE